MQKLPRDKDNDYTRDMAAARRDAAKAETGADLAHVGSYSFDPGVLPGNIEQHAVGKLRWLRFNYTTGDAAGQNMVSKATRHACLWMMDNGIPGLEHFTLAAQMDTDKKHSTLNNLHTRGKRVVAEITLPEQMVREVMHTSGAKIHQQRQLSNMGTLLSGSINNGSHFANGITALFIACGQDVANVAESSAGFVYGELKDNGDYYFSVTIPSLIVATYGGDRLRPVGVQPRPVRPQPQVSRGRAITRPRF